MPDLTWNQQHWTASVQLHRMRGKSELYGAGHGSPETSHVLRQVFDEWVAPFVSPDRTVVEVGSGGGRWSRYLVASQRLFCVDISAVMLEELQERLGSSPSLQCIQTDGTALPGIEPLSVDYGFSFDTFTHLELEVFESYLRSMKPLLKPSADVVLHYANQDLKGARKRPYYGDADPRRVESMVRVLGYEVVQHDTGLFSDSALIHLRPQEGQPIREPVPWPLDTDASFRVLAWPDYRSAEDLTALFGHFCQGLVGREDAVLCLRFDPRRDGPRETALEILQAAADQILGTAPLSVLLIESEMIRSDWARLGPSVQGVLVLPSSSQDGMRLDFLSAVGAPIMKDLYALTPRTCIHPTSVVRSRGASL